jgi:tellurite resistance protein
VLGSRTVRAEFLAALAHIDIGVLVATADGKVSSAELETLRHHVLESSQLVESERIRLAARLAYLSKYPPTLRILNPFKSRPASDREAVARLAIAVAMSNGHVDVEEVRLLERVYRTLDLPLPNLYSELQSAGIHDEPLAIVAAADPIKTVPIPKQPVATTGNRSAVLDANRLARTRAETAAVSSILGEIFRDEEDQDNEATAKQPSAGHSLANSDRSQFEGLDPKCAALLSIASERPTISRREFEDLSVDHGLMCNGAIEAINDWAFDRFGDAIIEDGEPQPKIDIATEIFEARLRGGFEAGFVALSPDICNEGLIEAQ